MTSAAECVEPTSEFEPLESFNSTIEDSPPILVLANSNKLSYAVICRVLPSPLVCCLVTVLAFP